MSVFTPYLDQTTGILRIFNHKGRANQTSVSVNWGDMPIGTLCLECRSKKSFTVGHPLSPHYFDLTDAFNTVLEGSGPVHVRLIFRDRPQNTLKVIEFTIVFDDSPSPYTWIE